MVVAVWLVIRLVVGLVQQPSEPTQEEATAALDSLTSRVTFEVEGEETYSADAWGMSADVTVTTESGSEQMQGADVPLVMKDGDVGYSVTVPAGSAVAFSAQISSDDSGDITCRITANGEMLVQNTSSGRYAVVSCSGVV